MFEHTNKVINAKNFQKIKRKKMLLSDVIGVNPICVPTAISNMGIGAPSYTAAADTCTKYCPEWMSQGGVYSSYVGPIIRKFIQVNTLANMSDYSGGYNLNNCVLLINKGGIIDHAVNAVFFIPCVSGEGPYIIYHDYTNGKDGSLMSAQMTAFYPFI